MADYSERCGRILLITSDQEEAGRIRALARSSAGETLEAHQSGSLAEALAVLRTEQVDAVVLDLNLPDGKAVSALKGLIRRYPGLPVLTLVSRVDTLIGAATVRAGAADFLVREVLSEEILRRAVLSLRRRDPADRSADRLWSPASERECLHDVPELSADDGPGQMATVLVVEDEAPVRRLLVALLARAGYDVHQAGCGFDAIETAGRLRDQRIDLLITDIVLPDMRGPQLAANLGSRAGVSRVIFISGYPARSIMRADDVTTGRAFLQKPFDPSELLEAARSLLASRTTQGEMSGATAHA